MGLLGSVSKALGLGGGANVASNYISPEQVAMAFQNTQTGLQQQQEFLKASQAQNGLQNQSNVFNQQQNLANNLQQQANGQGPNPALAQFNQATGQNVAQQAALMAGQRGAGANAGLMARQIGQQGAGIQQNAVGQSAIMQAQQQLAAQQQLQQQQNMMSQLSTQQVGQQQGSVNAYQQGAANQYGATTGAMAQQNASNLQNQQMQNNAAGSLLQGAVLGGMAAFGGPAAAGATKTFSGQGADFSNVAYSGGYISPRGVEHYAEGGDVSIEDTMHDWGNKIKDTLGAGKVEQVYRVPPAYNVRDMQNQILQNTSGPSSFVGKHLSNPNTQTPGMNAGGCVSGEMLAAKGKEVPGKAKVKGDNIKNDTVDAKLSPGEIVIPRSVAQHPDAPEMAKQFVAAIMAKKGKR